MYLSYLVTVVIVACGGIPKGWDEGGFSASVDLESFVIDYNLEPKNWVTRKAALENRIANITSLGVLGTALGALCALVLCDRYGRLRCWRGFAFLWASGMFMQVFASGILGLLYFARIWMGLGAGGLTVVSPLFLSEISPARSRGMVVSIFMVFLLTSLSIGFFANYGASVGIASTRGGNASDPAPNRAQYRLVQALPLIPVGLALVGSFFLLESPRWLAAQDRNDDAMVSLSHYRGADRHSASVRLEADEIRGQLSGRNQTLKGVRVTTLIREVFTVPTYRRRLALAVTMQIVAQWSGGNGITYYIPTIFEYAGVGTQTTALVASGAYGVVKLVFTMIFAWGLVDLFGRRPCFITGLSLELAAHVYLMFYTRFLAGDKHQAGTSTAILFVFVYGVGWSVGLCTVQYLYGTEIFPTRLRNICYAFIMVLHWLFQFAVVRVIPTMMLSLHHWGGFLFFAVVCAVGLVLLWFMAPETNRVPMEEMDELFAGAWYTGWNARVEIVQRHAELDNEKSASSTHVERVRSSSPTEEMRSSPFKRYEEAG